MAAPSRSVIAAPSVALLRALARPQQGFYKPSRYDLLCQGCLQQRAFRSTPAPAAKPPSFTAKTPVDPTLRTPESKHQRYRDGELQPKPLARPIGLFHPPQAGQNTGRDTRTLAQKRDDFASYEKYLERRKKMLSDVFENNYYKDIGNLGKIHRGKSILAPATPFRAELALYFPNLEGITLESGSQYRDTAPAMLGRVSVVSLLNTEWAAGQAQTFTSANANPELAVFMNTPEAKAAKAQFVTINVEENPLKAAFVRMFFWRLRRMFPEEQWATYFLNRRGLGAEIRDALGMWNSKVGYVYLVDGRGRVRWAANGDARDEEKKSLVNCMKRLVAEARGVQRLSAARQEPMKTVKQAAQTSTVEAVAA